MQLFARMIGSLVILTLPAGAMAAQQSFTDVPSGHPSFAAAEYLKENGVLQGYADGTFRPDQSVNRAEVIKVIVGNRITLADLKTGSGANSSFRDVPADAWFLPFVEQAYSSLRIIDGPPKTYDFAPDRSVTRAEFLKMLLLAYDVDPSGSYGEISYPLAEDVTTATDWYYPYVRYALTASMLTPENGRLEPGTELTRGDIADMLYRFLLYRQGKRTQTVLSVTENETLDALRMIESGNPGTAQYAAARAILAARGALAAQPEDTTAKGSVKIAEAAMALANAAAASAAGDSSRAIDLASTAWHLGAKAKEFSGAVNAIATQVQKTATDMADGARQ